MLRISTAQAAPQSVALQLEGQISGPWTAELSNACERELGDGNTVELDLADVTLVDRAGVTLLASLVPRGVRLTHTSLFLEEQLRLAVIAPQDIAHHCHEG